ncbi:IS200/IS605 family transposase [Nocardia sp. NPDC058658]|uniref:IS200/IS605 family transposase n=1 Tax=Nocardia sp. NPDC058658 TaxID=3346580 RepID=UPI00364DD90A
MVSEESYRRGRSVVSAMRVHLVFVTKHRYGMLTDELLTTCEKSMRAVCRDFEATLAEFNGERDHVHLVVQYPPKVAVSKLVNSLKGVSARRLRDQYPSWVDQHSLNGQLWSPSYFAASCGDAPTSIVAEYIEQQRRSPRRPGRPRSMP